MFIILSYREMQIKTTMRFHLLPVRMTKMKIQGTADAVKDVEKQENSSTAGQSASLYNHSGNQFGGSTED